MFNRIELLIGENVLNKIKEQRILLIGIGGVGGTCLEALVRSGFSHITIVDYDIFEISNINRQILSNSKVIGREKVDVALKRVLEINPNIDCDIKNIFLDQSNIDQFKSYDYIIDACDSISTKIEIIKFAYNNRIKLISSMGMGNRLDPTKVVKTKLSKTINDPLARKIRYLLKKANISFNPDVICSLEIPKKGLKTISSFMTVTSYAGLLLAQYIIDDIIKNNLEF